MGAQGNGDARRHGTGQGLPDGARRRREDRLPGGLGARAARPRARDHAHLGRGRERRRRPPARRDPRRSGRRAHPVAVDRRYAPAHEHSRGSSLQPRARVGARRPATSRASASPTSRRTAWATSCSCSCPTSASTSVAGASVSEIESTKSVSDVYVPVTGVVLGRERRARRAARARQLGPVRRRLDVRDRGRPTRPSSTALLDAAAYRAARSEG